MTVRRIHHVQITVPKNCEAAARDFYCVFLGLSEIEKASELRHRGGFWLAVGDQQLHIGVEDGVDRAASKAHLAYEVDDLDAWRNKFHAAGITIVESIPISGYERLEFRDPFGNRIELIQPSR